MSEIFLAGVWARYILQVDDRMNRWATREEKRVMYAPECYKRLRQESQWSTLEQLLRRPPSEDWWFEVNWLRCLSQRNHDTTQDKGMLLHTSS